MVKKKAKTKEWYTMISPKMFGEKEIGKALADSPESLVGRKVYLSILELAGNMNKYYMKISFKISRVEGKKAFTEFHGSQCMQDYVSRMVVRRVRRIDTVQDLNTKDNLKLRVKGIAVISRRAKSSIQTKMSNCIKETLKKEVESATLDDVIEKILSDEMKTRVLSAARRIYPIRNFEVRKTEILPAKETAQKS